MNNQNKDTARSLIEEDSEENKVDFPRRLSGKSQSESAKSFNIEDTETPKISENLNNKRSTLDSYYGYLMMLIGICLFSISTVLCKLTFINYWNNLCIVN